MTNPEMRSLRIHVRRALVVGLAVPSLVAAQTLAPKPSAIQHVTVAGTTSASSVTAGKTVTLYVDVTPKPGIHVYASDAQGLTPVALVLTPRAEITRGQVKFPVPEMMKTVGLTEATAVYRKPFRLEQPITVASTAKRGEDLRIAGVVNYQACDDRVCYPTASIPVSWTVKVQP